VARYIALRTGLTSLWSLEVIVPKMLAGQAWTYITRKAGENALVPMGLAGRDVLRIEAGLPRYGHEINETIDPLTAGLEGLLDESRSYRGASAVADLRSKGSGRRTVGLWIETPERTDAVKIPRRGSRVLDDDGVDVGTVTSGTYSPAIGAPLVLAQLASRCLAQESPLRVDVGGQVRFARRVELPVR
jgi:aminomethyltransferase